jgi:hypothetical protein
LVYARRLVVKDLLRKGALTEVEVLELQERIVPDGLFSLDDSAARRALEERDVQEPVAACGETLQGGRDAHLVVAVIGVGICIGISQPITVQAQGSPVRTVKDGILDEVKLFTATPPASKVVVIHPFSATDADIVNGDKGQETKKMQTTAPDILLQRGDLEAQVDGWFHRRVGARGRQPPPADAIVVDGKFTEMDPGSRAKRYFVGFGAGKSGVTVEGSVKASDGTVLATFRQRRVGVMGVGGGDSMEKLVDDTKAIGEDIAKFLSAWATGKKLK